MIIDQMANADIYAAMDARLAKGFRFLQKANFVGQAPGVYEVEGKELFYALQAFDTAPPDNTRWEAHQRYVDIQCILSGEEDVGYAPIAAKGATTTAYDPVRDIEYFESRGDFVHLKPGDLAVFFPWDAHLVGSHMQIASTVRKVVIKVLWED